MPLVHKRIPLHKGRVELNISIFMRIQKTDYPIVIVLIIEYNIFIISTSIMVHDTSYRKYGGINEKQLL